MRKLLGICALALLGGAAIADGTLDGVIGAGYGPAVGTDANVPTINAGGGILDVQDLYAARSGSDVYIAMTINGNITTTDWGNYMFYIETDNATNKAENGNGNGWNRPIQPAGTGGSGFRPTYWIGSWVNSGGGVQLWNWNGSAWGQAGTPAIAFVGGATSTLEYRIPWTDLGSPNSIQVVGMSSGGGGGDTAIDSVPAGNPDPVNWGDTVVMNDPSGAVTVPVELAEFGVE